MKNLESFVIKGTIRIAAKSGVLFAAEYCPHDRSAPISVQSDRGFVHLYTLLEAVISENTQLKDEINDTYRYSLSSVESRGRIESALRHCLIQMIFFDEYFCVIITEITVCEGSPGLFFRSGKAASLQQAFDDALAAPLNRSKEIPPFDDQPLV